MMMPGIPCHVKTSKNLSNNMILNFPRVPRLIVDTAIYVPNNNVYFIFKNLLPRYLVIFPLIVLPGPEPPGGFKYAKGRNEDCYFIYSFSTVESSKITSVQCLQFIDCSSDISSFVIIGEILL